MTQSFSHILDAAGSDVTILPPKRRRRRRDRSGQADAVWSRGAGRAEFSAAESRRLSAGSGWGRRKQTGPMLPVRPASVDPSAAYGVGGISVGAPAQFMQRPTDNAKSDPTQIKINDGWGFAPSDPVMHMPARPTTPLAPDPPSEYMSRFSDVARCVCVCAGWPAAARGPPVQQRQPVLLNSAGLLVSVHAQWGHVEGAAQRAHFVGHLRLRR